MIRLHFGLDLPWVQQALEDCGLVVQRGGSSYRCYDCVRPCLSVAFTPAQPRAHQVGLFPAMDRAGWYAGWDDTRGGFGLSFYVGELGASLLATYNFNVLYQLRPEVYRRLTEPLVSARGTCTFRFQIGEGDDMATLISEITPSGEVKTTVTGVAGPKCLELTKSLEEALGTVVNRAETPAMHQTEQQTLREQA